MTIGVLAIQGDFAAHARALRSIGSEAIEVRRADDLELVDGLFIPGGESTTMLKFIEEEDMGQPIIKLARRAARSSERAPELFCWLERCITHRRRRLV